jgi:cytochrome c peroxidase
MRRAPFYCSCVVLALAACGQNAKSRVEVDGNKLRLFRPLPAAFQSKANPITEEKVALGRMLYYDPRLSKGQDVSCNRCHLLEAYGVDGKVVSHGHRGQKGDRNSPSVFNAAGHFVQFWDGRAENVEQQAKVPVTNPVEMAMRAEEDVVAVLRSIPGYVEAFRRAFPGENDPVTFDHMAQAIGAFERKLVTPGRWDLLLKGDRSALTDLEKAGFNRFVEAGCHSCHAGVLVGAQIYQKLGVKKRWPRTVDPGRYKVTGHQGDMFIFKVASLRNVEKTSPYFHDGSVATLDGAVRMMADHQLGLTLRPDEVAAIVAWLRALTGEIPREYIRAPVLPGSTAATPKPDAN